MCHCDSRKAPRANGRDFLDPASIGGATLALGQIQLFDEVLMSDPVLKALLLREKSNAPFWQQEKGKHDAWASHHARKRHNNHESMRYYMLGR